MTPTWVRRHPLDALVGQTADRRGRLCILPWSVEALPAAPRLPRLASGWKVFTLPRRNAGWLRAGRRPKCLGQQVPDGAVRIVVAAPIPPSPDYSRSTRE